jgi:hypothetical protein
MTRTTAEQWSIFPVRATGYRLFRTLPREYKQFLFWLASGDYSRADYSLEGSNDPITLDHLMLVAYHNGVLPACVLALDGRYDSMLSSCARACFDTLQTRQHAVTETTRQLVEVLDAANAAHSIIKGSKLSKYYPCSSLRTYRDIDMVIENPTDLVVAVEAVGRLGGQVRRAPCRLADSSIEGFAFKCSVPANGLADIVVEFHVGALHLGSAGSRLAGLYQLVTPGSAAGDLLTQSCEWMSRYGAYQLRDYLDFHFLAIALGDEFDKVLRTARSVGLSNSLLAVAGGHEILTGETRSMGELSRIESLIYLAPEVSSLFSRSMLRVEASTSKLGLSFSSEIGRARWVEGRFDPHETSAIPRWVTRPDGEPYLISPLGSIFPPTTTQMGIDLYA